MISLMRQKQLARHLWSRYATLNVGVAFVAAVVALSWVWGSISMIQTNFDAQKTVDERQRELDLLELEVATLEYQKNYYRSDEYKALQARAKLGLASDGEKVLLLPDNSAAVKEQDALDSTAPGGGATTYTAATTSNFQQWLDFLTGKSASRLQKR